MKKLILYIWQLPQNIIGLALLLYFRKEKRIFSYKDRRFYIAPTMSGGISLGNYIILSDYNKYREPVYNHEFGHSRQSIYLGLLYLPIVGLCSLLHALFHRRGNNYYNFWTERWANKLGGIEDYKGEYHYHKQGIIPTTLEYLIDKWGKISKNG